MEFKQIIQKVREKTLLVYSLTNQVVANDVSNTLHAIGADKTVSTGVSGSKTFRSGLFDILAALTDEDLKINFRIERVS